MSNIKALVLATLLPSVAVADELGPQPNDPGKVTGIKRGVFEADVSGIFVISHDRRGSDTQSDTRVSATGSIGGQYFVANNVSVGAAFLVHYDKVSASSFSQGFGGLAFASLHIRLGLGAFFRPTIGGGVIKGDLETEVTPGMVVRSSQIAGRVRIAIPFAYFPSKRIVIQAGPELNITAGNATPEGGEAESFTTVAGGFGVGAGYTF
jgi:hypothetical protein